MKSMRLVAAAAFLVLAACSSSATEPAARADRPSFDGGNTLGSGNRTDDNGGGMLGSGNDAQTTGTVPPDTTQTGTEDGGGMMGSGN
jgi:hypothetical protein